MDLLYRQTYLQEDQVALLHKGSDGLVIQKDHLPVVLLYRGIRWTAHREGPYGLIYTNAVYRRVKRHCHIGGRTEGSDGLVTQKDHLQMAFFYRKTIYRRIR